MKKRTNTKATAQANMFQPGEYVRIAPLHHPKPSINIGALVGNREEAGQDLFDGQPHPAPASAHLIYSGGPLIPNVEVFTIFWGKLWGQSPSSTTLMQQLNQFFGAIVSSSLSDQLAEYNVSGQTIGHGSFIGTKVISANAPSRSITDSAIQAQLKSWIASKTVPPPTNNTLYFIYLDPKVVSIMGGSKSCQSYCGYHNNAGTVYYAVMPYPTCSGCLGGLKAFEALRARVHTSCARRLPTRFLVRVGMTARMGKSATFAPGTSKPSPVTTFRLSGRTTRTSVPSQFDEQKRSKRMNPHNPIEHVVIIVKENHTFDNYFGTFPGANGVTLPKASDPPAHDQPHDHAAWLNRATGAVQLQYKQGDIPTYFSYAQQYTLCDNYFTEVTSQSEPNHLMLIAAASPVIDNTSASRTYQPQPPFNLPSLPTSLVKAGLTWGSFGPQKNYFSEIVALKGNPNIALAAKFDSDVAAGSLPNVSWLYAPGSPTELSEHPPASVKLGMQWTAGRVSLLAKSKYWATCAIFITWDDWGGWYDHVTPPLKDTWTGVGPSKGPSYTNTQFSYGSRVGCLVISPYAKKGISKTFHSHVSIVKFCETTFGLAPLNARDAASDDMSDCLDFKQNPLPPPA